MYQLYLDFDGVIWDSWEAYDRIFAETDVELYEKIKSKNITEEDASRIREIYKTIDWERVFKETQPLNNSIDYIKYLQEINMFNISVLTHCNSQNEINFKRKVIDYYLDNIQVIPVIQPSCKTTAVNPKGAILVDDYGKNVKAWQEAGGLGIKFSILDEEDCPYYLINSLDKIPDIINVVEKSKLILKKK